MGKYYKLDKNNIVENIILAEENFINSLKEKDFYIKEPTSVEEKEESLNNKIYSINIGDIGLYYNKEKRKFKKIKPFESWIWDEEKYEWEPPTNKPNEIEYYWNEKNQTWEKYEKINS
jgi:hypothetical protein